MTGIAVRRAAAADAGSVLRLREQAIRVSAAGLYEPAAIEAWASGGVEAKVRALIEATSGFVAVHGETVIGWANLDGEEVHQLYVHPAHGGRGVARAMYEVVEYEARNRGLRRLSVTASLRSAPVFERFGFTATEHHVRSYHGHDFQVVSMAKQLPPVPGPTACLRR